MFEELNPGQRYNWDSGEIDHDHYYKYILFLGIVISMVNFKNHFLKTVQFLFSFFLYFYNTNQQKKFNF